MPAPSLSTAYVLTCLRAMLRFSPQLIFISFSLYTSVQNVPLVDRLPSASDAVSFICCIQNVVQKISLHAALYTIKETYSDCDYFRGLFRQAINIYSQR